MSVELFIESETPPMSWQEFKDGYPARSIALDGFVADGPKYDSQGPYLNANHHENVDRLATLSTAQQILMYIRMGLDQAFTLDGAFEARVYVNDCDQDICASWYLLDNIDEAKAVSNPALNRFVSVAGILDATAGSYPYAPDMKLLEELAWVFEPYRVFRATGRMALKDNFEYRSVIDEVSQRIGDHLLGRGATAKIDTRYKLFGGGEKWKMLSEICLDGKIGAFNDGIDAYVVVQGLPNDRWRYTVGKRSDFIPFDLGRIFDALNEAENNKKESWGGATTIGGSPRYSGSRLRPEEVEDIINSVA